MHPILRLYEDLFSGGAAAASLPALARMIFVVHGAATIDGKSLSDGEAWHGEGACSLTTGKDGVTLWRFELAASGSATPIKGAFRSQEKLAAALETIPPGELLLRGDSVAFPPGGCAFLHKHWGPGIRCLLDGGIRIDTHGRSTSYGPGSAWYETGSDPVFAQAAMDRPSRFIRVMVLPRELIGKSSFQFVNEEDKAKPRVQQYKIFTDMPIATPRPNAHWLCAPPRRIHWSCGDGLSGRNGSWQRLARNSQVGSEARGEKSQAADQAKTAKLKGRKVVKRKAKRAMPPKKQGLIASARADGDRYARSPPQARGHNTFED